MQYQWFIPLLIALSGLSPAIFAATASNQGQTAVITANTPNTKALTDFYDVIPNVANCNEGVLKTVEKEKALTRLNMIRALSGLPAVIYDNANDTQTAKSALMSVANSQLNHTPPNNWLCWTQAGYNGSSTGNLYITWSSISSFNTSTEYFLDGWLIDDNVESLGHRRWVLDPFLPRTSFGRVDGTTSVSSAYPYATGATLKVIYGEAANISNTTLEYVAYPVGNYPIALFNKNWYLSFSVLADKTNKWNNSNVSFANSTITVTGPNGAMTVSAIKYDNNGMGVPNNLQWKVAGLQDNVQYSVNIGNVMVNNQARAYNYSFKFTNSTTPTLPTATTNAATNIALTSATLNGAVNDNGAATAVTFDFGTTTSYGTSLAATPATIAAGTGNKSVTANKTGLTCGTTYHYRVKAVNSVGTTYGVNKTFTALACNGNNTDLKLVLTDDRTSINPGATSTYRAVVSNIGSVAANNTVLKAPAVANLTVTSITCGTVLAGAVCPTNLTVALLQGTGIKILTLPKNGGMTFRINAKVAATATGNLRYTATLTAPAGVTDINPSNNTATDNNSISTSNVKPDLVITGITLTPAVPTANSNFSAAVTVKNQGSIASASCSSYLDIWINSTTVQVCGADGDKWASVGSIAAGASKTITISGLAAGVAGTKTLRAFVDSYCKVVESNDNNNQFTKVYTVQ